MATVRRYDTGTLQKAEDTPQGGKRIPAFVTRVGVFTYRLSDGGVRRELRPPEEVFRGDSIASLSAAPVTDLHPEKDGIRIPVTADNWKTYAVGHAAEDARADGSHVAATLLIQDRGMVDRIARGEREEVSCGYNCRLDPTAGIWEPTGEQYDSVQRDIAYNHVALGPKGWGRAGPSVALRLDSDEALEEQAKDLPPMKETINGIEYTVGSAEWGQAKAAQAKEAQTRADAAEAKLEAANNRIKVLEPAADPKAFLAAVTRRSTLILGCGQIARAKKTTFDAAAAIAAPEGDLVVRAIQMMDPNYKVEGKTPEALAAVFEYMLGALLSDEAAEGEPAAPALDDKGQPMPVPAPGTDPTKEPKADGGPGGKPRDIFGARAGVQPPAGQGNRSDAAQDPVAEHQKAQAGRASKPLGLTK